MTYHSYFRAKKHELLALVEESAIIAEKGILPILEPVNTTYKPTIKSCKKLNDANCAFVIIANSTSGKCLTESVEHVNHIKEIAKYNKNNKIGILIDSSIFEIKKLIDFISVYSEFKLVAIHPKSKRKTSYFEVARDFSSISKNFEFNIFLNEDKIFTPKLSEPTSIVIDGFKKQNNALYLEEEEFSNLHLNYKNKECFAFGDFNIIGDNYSEKGFAAYAVAIHITYVSLNDKSIRIIHAKSSSNEDISNQENKYQEARRDLIRIIQSNKYNITITKGLSKIISDNEYHGLGVLKQYCMEHHLELIGKTIL